MSGALLLCLECCERLFALAEFAGAEGDCGVMLGIVRMLLGLVFARLLVCMAEQFSVDGTCATVRFFL